MASFYSIESAYDIIDNDNGGIISIESDPDGMNTIHVSPKGKESEFLYGTWEFWLDLEQAKAFVESLSRKIADMEQENSG